MLEVLSILFVILGMTLMLNACHTLRKTNTSDKSYVETFDTNTTYEKGKVSVTAKGDSIKASGDNLVVKYFYKDSVIVRDSISLRDSVVILYKNKILNTSDYKVNHLPVYAISKYGFARADVTDSKLNIFMEIYERVITAEVDSLVKINTNTKTIVDKEKISESKTKVISMTFILIVLLVVAILVIVMMVRRKLKV